MGEVRAIIVDKETPWRCGNPSCHALLGVVVAGTLVMRQHARSGRTRERVIRVPSGTVEQDCYRCGLTNLLVLAAGPPQDDRPVAC